MSIRHRFLAGNSPLKNGFLTVDPVNGSDSMGATGREDRPYATINSALTDATAGDTIFLLPGTHTLTANLDWKSSVSLIGSGMYSTIIANNAFEFNINDKNDIYIEGVQVDATSSTNGITISNESYSINIVNCIFKDATENGIDAVKVGNLTLTNVHCVDNTVDGIFLQNNGGFLAGNNFQLAPTVISGCRFIGNTQNGMNVDTDHDISVNGCHIERNSRNGLLATRPVQFVFTGNTIERNGSDSDTGSYESADIRIVVDDDQAFTPDTFNHQTIVITGNQIGALTATRGIRINSAATADDIQIVITGNHINLKGSHGISAGLRSGHMVLIGSNIISVTDSATSCITLGVYDDSTHQDVTGCLITGNVMDNHGNTLTDYIRIARLDTVVIKGNLFSGNGTNGIEAGVDSAVLAENNTFDTNLTTETQTAGSPVGVLTETGSTTI